MVRFQGVSKLCGSNSVTTGKISSCDEEHVIEVTSENIAASTVSRPETVRTREQAEKRTHDDDVILELTAAWDLAAGKRALLLLERQPPADTEKGLLSILQG